MSLLKPPPCSPPYYAGVEPHSLPHHDSQHFFHLILISYDAGCMHLPPFRALESCG